MSLSGLGQRPQLWPAATCGRYLVGTYVRRQWVIAMVVASITGCADAPGVADRLDLLFSEEADILDLTHALSASGPFWPQSSGNPFRHDTLSRHPDGTPSMAAYSTPEHHGTHLDAPVHSAAGQASVDRLTPDHLFGPAAVIDITDRAAENPDYVLTRDDLLGWERVNGPLPRGAIVLLSTGWSRKWDDPTAYRNQGADARMHFPGFSESAARMLVTERDIRGIGIDNFSVDAGTADGFPVHGVVNGAGKFHLENVANVHMLPAVGAYLIVAPIKIEGGSGGQVRIFAVVSNTN